MIEVKDLQKSFPVKETFFKALISAFTGKQRFIRAVNGVSFTAQEGEILGLAGESGCGKTTTCMLLLRLDTPSGGTIEFQGKDLSSLKGSELSEFRRKAQLIFQDPYESLNPRFTVLRTIEEPLIVNKVRDKVERRDRVLQAMERSRLTPVEEYLRKYPHELSGGERQRVCIARAIVLEPSFLVADEAVSMLDVSIRASVLNLLRELTDEMHMAALYISHDLSLLGSICDKIAIMYAGEIVEMGTPAEVINSPCHPYTKALVAAVPVPEFYRRKAKLASIIGEPPDLIDFPQGCPFQPRCDVAEDICISQKPDLCETKQKHLVACHLHGATAARG